MNSKNNIPDISYYRLLLLDFLRESHPERLGDERFINFRAEAATESYSKAKLDGSDDACANEEAHSILFQGLYFSKHDTLVTILWNEFAGIVPEDDAKELATLLLSECESVFAGYHLSDDFAYTPEYDLLYTELTGTIAQYLENHGI